MTVFRWPRYSLRTMLLAFPLAATLLVGWQWWHRAPTENFGHIDWVSYSKAAFDRAKSESKPVLIFVRADYAISSAIVEVTGVELPSVARAISNRHVVPFRADLEAIDKKDYAHLKSMGMAVVPLMVIYPADSGAEPIVLDGVLTEQGVLAAIREIALPPEPSNPYLVFILFAAFQVGMLLGLPWWLALRSETTTTDHGDS